MQTAIPPDDELPPAAAYSDEHILAGMSKPGTSRRFNGSHGANTGATAGDKPKRLVQTGEEFLAAYRPVDYVVDGLLIRGYLYGLTSRPNHGKTTVATAIAVHVANDRPLAGLEVSAGRVLMLYGENAENSRLLLAAALQHYQFDVGAMDIIGVAGPISDMLDQIIGECDQEYALVVVDSAAAYFGGDKENDNTQNGQHARDLRRLTELKGHPAVLICCHPVKDADKDRLFPRGGGAFLAELDTNLTLWATDGTAELSHNKVRGPALDNINFSMPMVTLADGYQDTKGRPMSAPVALPMTEQQFMAATRKATEFEDRLLYQLLHHANGSMADWTTGCGLDAKAEKYKVQRMLKALVEEKLVQHRRRKYSLTKAGESEAKKVR